MLNRFNVLRILILRNFPNANLFKSTLWSIFDAVRPRMVDRLGRQTWAPVVIVGCGSDPGHNPLKNTGAVSSSTSSAWSEGPRGAGGHRHGEIGVVQALGLPSRVAG